MVDRALISAEEEYLVFLDRAADYTAKLIASQGISRQPEGVARVEVAVAKELESVAVQAVGAALGDEGNGG